MVHSSDPGSAVPPTGLGRAELWGGLTRLMTDSARGEADPQTPCKWQSHTEAPGDRNSGVSRSWQQGHRHANGTGLQCLRSTPALPNSKKAVQRPSSCCTFLTTDPASLRPPPGNLEVSLPLCTSIHLPESGLQSQSRSSWGGPVVFTSLSKREMEREDQMESPWNQFLKRPQQHRGE